MKTLSKRVLALALAAALLLSLAGCKKTESASDPGGTMSASSVGTNSPGTSSSPTAEPGAIVREGVEKVTLEHVYTVNYLDLGADFNSGFNLSGSGNNLLLSSYYYEEFTDEDGNYTGYRSGTALYHLDPDTLALELVMDNQDPDWSAMDEEVTSYDYTWLGSWTCAPDGTLWYSEQRTHEDWSDEFNYVYEVALDLVHVDAQGTELSRFPIESENDYVYINNLWALPDGRVVVQLDDGLRVLDETGATVGQLAIDGEDSWMDNLCFTGNGELIATLRNYMDNSYTLNRVDLTTGQLEPLGEMPMTYSRGLLTGPEDTVYLWNEIGVFSYDIHTGQYGEILNWINSDINGNRLNSLVSLEDGTFLVTEYDRNYNGANLALLSPAAPADPGLGLSGRQSAGRHHQLQQAKRGLPHRISGLFQL